MTKKTTKFRTPGQLARFKLNRAMAHAVRDGKSVREVAAKFGKTETTVRLACVTHKVKYPRLKRGAKSKYELRKQLAEAVRSGRKAAEVAKSSGMPYSAVIRGCREQGVPMVRLQQGSSMEILAAIIGGATPSQVAKRYSVSPQRVRQIIKKAKNAGVFAAIELIRKLCPQPETAQSS